MIAFCSAGFLSEIPEATEALQLLASLVNLLHDQALQALVTFMHLNIHYYSCAV